MNNKKIWKYPKDNTLGDNKSKEQTLKMLVVQSLQGKLDFLHQYQALQPVLGSLISVPCQ